MTHLLQTGGGGVSILLQMNDKMVYEEQVLYPLECCCSESYHINAICLKIPFSTTVKVKDYLRFFPYFFHFFTHMRGCSRHRLIKLQLSTEVPRWIKK